MGFGHSPTRVTAASAESAAAVTPALGASCGMAAMDPSFLREVRSATLICACGMMHAARVVVVVECITGRESEMLSSLGWGSRSAR